MTGINSLFDKIDYKTYRDNQKTFFEITEMLMNDYIERQPQFIEQSFQKYLKDFVDVKDIASGDAVVYYVDKE